jgi:monovalent cation/hydrogen antiporter
MVELLIVVVIGLLAISAAATLGPRLGFAAPLLLVAAGIGASLLPFVPEVHVEPEWILSGVLPPLLYSASVSMPAMNFRREFGAISGLSFVLVVVSSLVVGAVFAWLIPGLGLAWGIALGAIVSPTDAVATSIVKRAGAPSRVVTILEGESLLNDATALVILRAAIAGAAVSVSLWGVLYSFAYSIAIAGIVGFVVGHLNLLVRARIEEASVNTAISFTVPFLAAIPAEELGASGLVAAVVAGLVTGHHAPQFLSPQHRLSDSQNWRTVELILEGAVFLVMGLELSAIVGDVGADSTSIGVAAGLAVVALLLTILVRAAYMAPLLAGLKSRASRGERMKPWIAATQDRFDDPEAAEKASERFGNRRMPSAARMDRFRTRLRRLVADIDYLLAQPLGWREGTIIVWAGMRGAITLAAAQTLPEDTPSRSLLILVAFLVATSSLLLQGGTLAPLISLVKPGGMDESVIHDERLRLMILLEQTATLVAEERGVDLARVSGEGLERVADQGHDQKSLTLDVISAQRKALLDARDDGDFSADALNAALAVLDADQISLEIKGAPTDHVQDHG